MKSLFHLIKSHFYAVILLVTLASIGLTHTASPNTLAIIYALGLTTKECILFLLPALIFGCGFRCVSQLKSESTKLLGYLIVLIVISNFIASWAGFGFIKLISAEISLPSQVETQTLSAAWEFTVYKPISNRLALFAGILFAIALHFMQFSGKAHLSQRINQATRALLDYILLPLLPFFMLGFLVKMLYEGSLGALFHQYLTLAVILIISYSVYLFFIFMAVSQFNIRTALQRLWHLVPAGWLGFSTLSGLAALPLTIQGTEKNIQHKPLAGGVLPLSSNIHLIGESLTLTILSIMIYHFYFGSLPTVSMFLHYSFMWAISAFSIAAVPAGSIMVMIPVFSAVFGFNAEMIAFMTLIYLFIEPLSTIINVMGNGFIVQLIDRIYSRGKPAPTSDSVVAPNTTASR